MPPHHSTCYHIRDESVYLKWGSQRDRTYKHWPQYQACLFSVTHFSNYRTKSMKDAHVQLYNNANCTNVIIYKHGNTCTKNAMKMETSINRFRNIIQKNFD